MEILLFGNIQMSVRFYFVTRFKGTSKMSFSQMIDAMKETHEKKKIIKEVLLLTKHKS